MKPSSAEGVLPVDKPAGPSSHDMVARARAALGIRRIGHTGTLDPFASGLLLLCLGPATRLAEYLTGLPKTYRGTLRLGSTTDTDDATGATLATSEAWRELTTQEVATALGAMTGRMLQRPPAYSAKKVGGERSYRLARQGVALDLAPVEVEVYGLDVTRIALPDVDFAITCSAGTYIRSIARDVGDSLGVGGHLIALRRSAIGAHSVAGALTPAALADPAAVAAVLLAPLDALRHMPRIDVEGPDADAIRHGRPVSAPPLAAVGDVVLASGGTLLAIAESDGSVLRPRKVFLDG